jgi:integrase
VGTTGKGRASKAGNDNAARIQLGPFWLWYRRERDEWCICWYDSGRDESSRRTCRKSTGIGGGGDGPPPATAQDALVAHYEAWRKPIEVKPEEAHVESLMADWLLKHANVNLADPVRYANGIAHWQRFFISERRAGMLTGEPVVSDVKPALIERFIAFREADGISRHTISRDIAALRQPLNWAWKNHIIAAAPFVPDVKDKPEARDVVYDAKQVAALLEAAWHVPERRQVVMFALIMLSTHGRGDAVLQLDASQIQDGLIYFNPPGRKQTKKRRSVVPIAPTLAPWLEGLAGRVITWQRPRLNRDTGLTEYDTFPCDSIDNAFEKSLIAAGICAQAVGADGEPAWLPPRAKLGETAPRPKIVGIGSPNTLRHTCSTEMHMRGIPEAQIDRAAGHAGDGTNKKHYRHLRPDYLREFIAGVEDYWSVVGQHTKVHLRSHSDPKIIDFGAARVGRSK